MKNFFIFLALLLPMIAGAESYTIDFSTNVFNLSATNPGVGNGSKTCSYDGKTFTIKSTNYAYWYNKSCLMIGKSNSYLELPAFDFKATSIEITGSNNSSISKTKMNIYVGDKAISAETIGLQNKTNTYQIPEEYQSDGTLYRIQITSDNYAQITKIVVNGYAPAVAKPAFDVAAGTILPGTEVAISCPTEGASIFYTTDGTTPTAESASYSSPVAIHDDCTLQAIAVLGADVSSVCEASYTVLKGAVDALSLSAFGIAGGSAEFAECSASINGTKYSAFLAGGNDAMQIRFMYNDSGIVTFETNSHARKIIVKWNANTPDDYELIVYGKDTAYSSPSDLYFTAPQGDKIGTVTCGKSDALDIEGDYQYIGFRPNNIYSNYLYIDEILVVWDETEMPEPEFEAPESLFIWGTLGDGNPVEMTADGSGEYKADNIEVIADDAGRAHVWFGSDLIESDGIRWFGASEAIPSRAAAQPATLCEGSNAPIELTDGQGKYNFIVTLAGDKMEANIEKADDGTTGVENVNADSLTPARYFDLQGNEIAAPASGKIHIVLKNGRATKAVGKY